MMKLLRQVYQVIAILAVLNGAALAGLAGFLWSRGVLNAERVEKLASVLRGELDEGPDMANAQSNGVAEAASDDDPALERGLEQGIGRLQAERSRTELGQQLALVTREMIRVREERDRFDAERTRELEAAKKKAEQTREAGFQKQLQYFESLKPALALELLLGREDEEAADLLRSMDTRKGRKIIEAARTMDQKKRMDGIMRLLPELNSIAASAEPTEGPSRSVP